MKKIEEIMVLVARFGEYAQIAARKDLHGSMDDWLSADEKQCEKFKEIETALRELVEQTSHAGFENGCKSMEEDQSWS